MGSQPTLDPAPTRPPDTGQQQPPDAVEGRAELVTDQAVQALVDGSWRRKYVDPYSGARASIFENPEDDLYRVRPDRVMTWSYGTVGTRTDFVRL